MTQNTHPAPPPVAGRFAEVRLITKLVARVRELAEGGESYGATALEREIWDGVLEAIASGNAQAGYLAAEALNTKLIEFPRTAVVDMGEFLI